MMCAPDSPPPKSKTTTATATATATATSSRDLPPSPSSLSSTSYFDDDDDIDVDSSSSSSSSSLVMTARVQTATMRCVVSLCLVLTAVTSTIPYTQAHREAAGCGATDCAGSLQAIQSTVTLVGGAVVGRWSDLWTNLPMWLCGGRARPTLLLVGVLAAALTLVGTWAARGPWGLALSLLPLGLQQNVHVTKALVQDYHTALSQYYQQQQQQQQQQQDSPTTPSVETLRVQTAGQLGMATGLALMLGPVVGAQVLHSYHHALLWALVCLTTAALLIVTLPPVPRVGADTKDRNKNDKNDDNLATSQHQASSWLLSLASSFSSWWNIPSARSPAAWFLYTNRLLSATSYQMFRVVWSPSLRHRFALDPRQYGLFLGLVGLWLALSKGCLSPYVIRRFGGGDRRHQTTSKTKHNSSSSSSSTGVLLTLCAVVVTVARWGAWRVTSGMTEVYAWYALLMTSLGIQSTILTVDTQRVAGTKDAGGFWGILAAVDGLAGLLGPALLRIVTTTTTTRLDQQEQDNGWVMEGVTLLNALAALHMAWGYDRYIGSRVSGPVAATATATAVPAEKKTL